MVVFLLVAMVLLAFVIDRGRVYVEKSRLQNVVDSAALAGAKEFCGGTGDPKTTAVNFARDNYGVTLDPNRILVQTGNTAYISVPATSVIDTFFGGFVSSGTVAVGARATAARECRERFQFVASDWFTFTSSVTLNAPLFAGKCFNGGSQSTYNAILAVSSVPSFNCNTVDNRFNAAPIDLGTSPTIQAGYDPRYGVKNLTDESAYAGSGSDYYGTYGANPLATFPPSAACSAYTGTFSTQLSCSGDGPQVKNGDVIRASILTSGKINLQGADFDPNAGPILIYTSDATSGNSEAIELPTTVPKNVLVYAPNGQVRFNGAGTGMNGTIFANEIRTNGGSASADVGTDVTFAGDISLVQ